MEALRYLFTLRFIPVRPMRTAVALLVMMCISGALSYFFFMQQSLRLDEAQSLWQTTRTPWQIIQLLAGNVHVPLYHLLLHYWRIIFGDTVQTARLMSLLFLLLTIPAVYFLGKLAYNRHIGLFAALLISVSPFMNWYGNEIRMYTLFTFLVILNQYFFIKIFKHQSKGAWWGYAITTFIGVYSHYFFFLSLFAQVVFYFLNVKLFPRGSFWKFFLTAVGVVLIYLPWIYLFIYTGSVANQEPLLSTPTALNLFSTVTQFIFGFQDDHINTVFLSLWPIALVFGFISLRSSRRVKPVTKYLFLTVVLSIAIAFFISMTFVPVFVSRYLSFTIPSLYLLLAAHMWTYIPKYRLPLQAAFLLLIVAMLGVEIWSSATPVKEDYRGAVTYLNAHVSPQDVVVVSAPFTVYPVEYYYKGPAELDTLPLWNRYAFGAIPPFNEGALPDQVKSLTKDHQNLWLLLSYDQGYESKIKLYFDTHYKRLQMLHFSDDLNLYEYQVKY